MGKKHQIKISKKTTRGKAGKKWAKKILNQAIEYYVDEDMIINKK